VKPSCSGPIVFPPAVGESAVDVWSPQGRSLQGRKGARSREEGCQVQGGGKPVADQAEGKRCSLQTPEGKPTITHWLPPASPLGTGSSWRRRICPSRDPAGWCCLTRALHTHLLAPLHCSHSRDGSPTGCEAQQLSQEPGRVPCYQGQLNSPQNLTHNFHLAHNFFAAGNQAGLGGLLASLCFHAVVPRGCLGGKPTFPPEV